MSAAETRLLLAGGSGFTKELTATTRPDVILVDLPRLYEAG